MIDAAWDRHVRSLVVIRVSRLQNSCARARAYCLQIKPYFRTWLKTLRCASLDRFNSPREKL
jgi:hypothetical protein